MIGSIDFSIGPLKINIGDQAGETVFRPYLQTAGVLSLDDIAEHMSEHNSKYDEGDINAVLRQFIKCASEMILNGYKVNLGRFGTFRPSIRTTSEQSADAVTAANITDLRLAWSPGIRTRHLVDKVEFNLVGKRTNQKTLVSAEKNGQSSITLSQTSSSNSGTGSSGGAGGE